MSIATTKTIPLYGDRMAKAIPGQLYGDSDHIVLVKQAAEDIAFGSPLFATAADAHKVVGKDATKALKFVGIAGFTQQTAGCYEAERALNCVKVGFIYVEMTGAIKEGEAVYVKYADGSFVSETTKNAGTAADFVAINGYAIEAGVDGDIVAIRIVE